MDERVIKYFLGELTEEEQVELLKRRELDPEIKREFSSCQNMMAVLSLSPGLTDNESAFTRLRLLRRMKRRKRIKRLIYTSVGYAAAICLLVISTWFVATSGINNTGSALSAGRQELYVPAGQRARITLPDGTVAWLNAGSTLIYPSVFDEERLVTLTGEAYFDVSEDKERPFVVSAGAVDIKALGTQFNVYSYPKSSVQHTILVDGMVKIYKSGSEPDGIVLTPNHPLFYENGSFRLEAFNDNDVLLWKEGIYSFKNERLDAIINKLELYFDVDIIIKSPSILKKEYTGKFRQKDGVMEILRIIRKIHPFKIEKNDELNQITLSQ